VLFRGFRFAPPTARFLRAYGAIFLQKNYPQGKLGIVFSTQSYVSAFEIIAK